MKSAYEIFSSLLDHGCPQSVVDALVAEAEKVDAEEELAKTGYYKDFLTYDKIIEEVSLPEFDIKLNGVALQPFYPFFALDGRYVLSSSGIEWFANWELARERFPAASYFNASSNTILTQEFYTHVTLPCMPHFVEHGELGTTSTSKPVREITPGSVCAVNYPVVMLDDITERHHNTIAAIDCVSLPVGTVVSFPVIDEGPFDTGISRSSFDQLLFKMTLFGHILLQTQITDDSVVFRGRRRRKRRDRGRVDSDKPVVTTRPSRNIRDELLTAVFGDLATPNDYNCYQFDGEPSVLELKFAALVGDRFVNRAKKLYPSLPLLQAFFLFAPTLKDVPILVALFYNVQCIIAKDYSRWTYLDYMKISWDYYYLSRGPFGLLYSIHMNRIHRDRISPPLLDWLYASGLAYEGSPCSQVKEGFTVDVPIEFSLSSRFYLVGFCSFHVAIFSDIWKYGPSNPFEARELLEELSATYRTFDCVFLVSRHGARALDHTIPLGMINRPDAGCFE